MYLSYLRMSLYTCEIFEILNFYLVYAHVNNRKIYKRCKEKLRNFFILFYRQKNLPFRVCVGEMSEEYCR